MTHEADHKLTVLAGRDFRSTSVCCEYCGWSGVAGQLTVPGIDALASGVVYACPDCRRNIAWHGGLSVIEVDQELRQIRAELADELAATLNPPIGVPQKQTEPDFKSVRALIKDIA